MVALRAETRAACSVQRKVGMKVCLMVALRAQMKVECSAALRAKTRAPKRVVRLVEY